MRKLSILLIFLLAIFAVNFAFAAEPDMTVYVADIVEGETAHVSITLPGDAQGNVTVFVNGQDYHAEVINGKASVDLAGLNPGEYNVSVKYEGDANYSEVIKAADLKVNSSVSTNTSANASGELADNSNTTQVNSTFAAGDNASDTNTTNKTNTTNNTTPSNNTPVKQPDSKQPPKKEPPKKPFSELAKNPTGIPIILLVIVLIGVVFGAGLRKK